MISGLLTFGKGILKMHNIKTICNSIYKDARRRSIKKNLEFNIDNTYLQDIFPKNFICPILGYVMTPGKIYATNVSPSLDRINPSKGYIKGNVEFVSLLANRMMSNAHGPDLIRFARWINNKYKREGNNNDKKHIHKTQQLQLMFQF